MTTETTKNEENCDTSEDIVFDAMKEEYEHCVKRSEKLDNKIYILLTVCAFIFVLLTSIIEKASTFQMSQDMTKISLIIIYWLLLLVDVVIFCVLLEKLVVLLGSIEFQRLDILKTASGISVLCLRVSGRWKIIRQSARVQGEAMCAFPTTHYRRTGVRLLTARSICWKRFVHCPAER